MIHNTCDGGHTPLAARPPVIKMDGCTTRKTKEIAVCATIPPMTSKNAKTMNAAKKKAEEEEKKKKNRLKRHKSTHSAKKKGRSVKAGATGKDFGNKTSQNDIPKDSGGSMYPYLGSKTT